jgi:chemotaxis protein methyltransferase CheR
LDQKIHQVKNGAAKKIRIWSAGCSGGQEAYSIAMIIASYMKDYKDWDILILATDIDRNMLSKGTEGIYSAEEVDSLPEKFAKKFISELKNGEYHIDLELKETVRFKHLNLLHKWPFRNFFDAIFCRNVVIYFDNETKNDLVNSFSGKLHPDGMLYLGHSEAMIGENKNLRAVGRASFQRAVQ